MFLIVFSIKCVKKDLLLGLIFYYFLYTIYTTKFYKFNIFILDEPAGFS